MKTFTLLLACFALSIFAIGCKDKTPAGQGADAHSQDDGHDHGGDNHDGHDHAAEDHTAKHGGDLIEIGRQHAYHAELVDDEKTGKVTIYMMDAHMEPLTVKSETVILVLTVGDQTKAFNLKATEPGGSSEFQLTDPKMVEMLDAPEGKGKLRVTIEGTPLTGALGHHDHAGHDHAGHEH